MLLVYDSSYNFEPVFLNTRQLLLDLRVDVARSDRFLSRCGNTLFLELVLHELSSGLSLLEDDSDHYEWVKVLTLAGSVLEDDIEAEFNKAETLVLIGDLSFLEDSRINPVVDDLRNKEATNESHTDDWEDATTESRALVLRRHLLEVVYLPEQLHLK